MAYNAELSLNGVCFPDCCRKCKPPKRQAGCHAKCGDYITAKDSHEAKKAQIRQRKKTDYDAAMAVFTLKRN